MATLWLLGHQCSLRQPWFEELDKENDEVLLIENWNEKDWKGYHKQKLVLVFSIMRHFKKELEDAGYTVDYRKSTDVAEELEAHINEKQPDTVLVHQPSEEGMCRFIDTWRKKTTASVRIAEEGGFLMDRKEWKNLLPENENWQMDKLYRRFRKDFRVLLTKNGKPVGGKWSYDADNRKKPKKGTTFPEPAWESPDNITRSVIEEVEDGFSKLYGSTEHFAYPVTKKGAEKLLDHFMEHRLHTFGDYQDAMLPGEPFVSHSMLSAAINFSLLDPLDVIRRAEEAYQDEAAPLNAVEGFIRQILGWREYIRGVYLRSMPEYERVNELGHERDLPAFFWTAETNMHCMQDTVQSVVDHAYSHHIQRLMVLGNFATTAGIEPKQVSDWFNEMYIDALDWVVLPNVLGMALYADGGKMSTKPYVSSGNYIQKMSHYCRDCAYSVNEKYGENACPFHPLYWDFLERHEERFRDNPRMKVIYKHLDNRSSEDEKKQQETIDLVWKRMKEGTL
ncbi:cryptochrome/photolyase family protein [Alkalicoccus urumqiensis]|uniref:Cryptochrome/photolyase family protein n=1 Tax=Alkalicoccus urumqiensis TaxID=1548213 RepID=A0A2P6MK20_ALKUR|nr:cryptochrome/photolyase family protein [Alkalicoccus urumqiensis]PRO66642.1 cryptochrome/photolyase family protein [Alkalicoccus urumqiensis]